MRKLSLRLDSLRVETFSPDEAPPPGAGTVKAHVDEASAPHTCGCPSEYRTCGQALTCYDTCMCPSWSGAECNTVCIG